MKSRFTRLFEGLSKTREAIVGGVRNALSGRSSIGEDALLDIEETLIAADVGVATSQHLVSVIRREADGLADRGEEAVLRLLSDEIDSILSSAASRPMASPSARPLVIMVVGVNGVGKTTTIGKLAHRFAQEKKSVLLAAADTFRAAAPEQLRIWAERTGADIVSGLEGGDSAAVAYDALDAAISRDVDVLIVDTAGRLHTQKNLLDELSKVKRVLAKRAEGVPHEVLLVVDANTGQNALAQARMFNEAVGLTGLVLAKLDGTARGGIVVAIGRELSVPVRFVGTGEGVADLEAFDADEFTTGLVGAVPGASD